MKVRNPQIIKINGIRYVDLSEYVSLEQISKHKIGNLEVELKLETLAKDDLQERNEIQFKQIKELEEENLIMEVEILRYKQALKK